jgi:hypothetical protein
MPVVGGCDANTIELVGSEVEWEKLKIELREIAHWRRVEVVEPAAVLSGRLEVAMNIALGWMEWMETVW